MKTRLKLTWSDQQGVRDAKSREKGEKDRDRKTKQINS